MLLSRGHASVRLMSLIRRQYGLWHAIPDRAPRRIAMRQLLQCYAREAYRRLIHVAAPPRLAAALHSAISCRRRPG